MAGNNRLADVPIAIDGVICRGLDLLILRCSLPWQLAQAVSLGGFEKRIKQAIPHGLGGCCRRSRFQTSSIG